MLELSKQDTRHEVSVHLFCFPAYRTALFSAYRTALNLSDSCKHILGMRYAVVVTRGHYVVSSTSLATAYTCRRCCVA